ncbi:MAG: AGE family epimerase/isomerase [Paracoccus sp. (in: a-proteobacteria)]|nr:AGE family epimerase/isomerase [Paracoccus sp. (in: a-proteobacteria)]
MTMQAGNPEYQGLWLDDPVHRAFLAADACRTLDFFDASPRPGGGFRLLDARGAPRKTTLQELHTTTRLVHSYALAHLAGRPDGAGIIDQGMDYLWRRHRDRVHGGYLWALEGDRIADGTKLAYGQGFVLLAASSARLAGHPDADRLLADVAEVLDHHFWDDTVGLLRDEFTRDWQPFSNYRGMNGNMHGVEALLAAHEVTGEGLFLRRAGAILDFFLLRQAEAYGWRIPEHHDAQWQVDPDYAGDPVFRPRGTTPGHSLEFARLGLQWWDLAGRPDHPMPRIARKLVDVALDGGWDGERGGLVYTLNLRNGAVDNPARYWWPVTEAVSAVAALIAIHPDPALEQWYRKIWQFAADCLVDPRGGWVHALDKQNRPCEAQFVGKPDIYHSLQSDLIPLSGALSNVGRALRLRKPLSGTPIQGPSL